MVRVASTCVETGLPGAVGLNVTCRPLAPTAVHWVAEGHDTAFMMFTASITVGVVAPGAAGLNVIWRLGPMGLA